MKRNDAIFIIFVSVVLGSPMFLFLYGIWRGNVVYSQNQAIFENKLHEVGIQPIRATLDHSPTVIIDLKESEFLTKSENETVYNYGNRYIIFSENWQVAYEYKVERPYWVFP